MLIDIIWLIVGLILIMVGANFLTDGSSALAKRLGVSDFVVGMTVVAIGTSMPELVISAISAANNSAQLAIGNVVGSNIFNLLMIVGVTALVCPIKIEKRALRMEMPLLILSSFILIVLGNSALLNGDGKNEITRIDSFFLIVLFALFIVYSIAVSKPKNENEASNNDKEKNEKKTSGVKISLLIIAGLILLIFGGDKFVSGAKGLAYGLGVSEAVVGLTIVAFGTSLPELATSVVAALKNKPGLAIGNVIGSNISNVLLVLGVSGVINPLTFGNIGNFDLITLFVASILFLIFGRLFGVRKITRIEGGLLVLCYLFYIFCLLKKL